MVAFIKLLLLIFPLFYFIFGLNNLAFCQNIYSTPPSRGYDLDEYSQNTTGNENTPDYYIEGLEYLKSHQYTNAIDYLGKALSSNPDKNNTRVNLAVAHINRGTYFYNYEKDFTKAANDYRNAIFVLKYDQIIPNIPEAEENIKIAFTNLNNIFTDAKISSTKSSRLKIARELRGQGKLRESIVEFHAALAGNQTDLPLYTAVADIYSALDIKYGAAKYYQKAANLNSGSLELRLKLAKSLYDSGNSENAVSEYNVALNLAKDEDKTKVLDSLQEIWVKKLQENPQDAVSHMNLGVVLQKKGDFDGALKEYQIAQNINPNDITLRLNIGTLYQATKNFDTAIKAYDSILEAKPDFMLAHYYRGTAYKEMGNVEGAIKAFQLVLSREPDNSDAKKALLDTVKLLPNQQDVASIYKTFAVDNPNDAAAQYNYAYQIHSSGNFDEALTYYKKSIAINPKLSDAYLNIAAIYKKKKQTKDAISSLKDGLSACGENKKMKDMLNIFISERATEQYQNAIKLYNQGKYSEAIMEYQSIIKISEPDSDLYVNLGAAYQASKNLNEAINAYKKAIEINPKNTTAHYYIGNVYSLQNKNSDAIKAYTKALALDPTNTDIKQAMEESKLQVKKYDVKFSLQKGIEEYKKGKYSNALLTFNTLSMKDPENADVLYYRGMVYDALKKYQIAIADYKSALKYKPDLTFAYYAIAVDYDAIKNYAEAKKWYRVFIDKSGISADQYVKYAKDRIKQI